eukprot:TRINITY_DN24521_c0_g1_i3.p1 TRINITY_DN24521_c0_g1~~TRINITY_DN24521_c0_g1_i3.p1  ORF type:complete len:544 (-),score=123.52 TRINITY_DN24521_c0_g1_i3:17-1648(-)
MMQLQWHKLVGAIYLSVPILKRELVLVMIITAGVMTVTDRLFGMESSGINAEYGGNYPYRFPMMVDSLSFSAIWDWIGNTRSSIFAKAHKMTLGTLSSITGKSSTKIEGMKWSRKDRNAFPTVVLSGVLLCLGKWYYEVTLHDATAVAQIGWGDLSFRPNSEKGIGVGDDHHSWGYDGNRQTIWHGGEYKKNQGIKWKDGDVIGMALDLDQRTISFSQNGCWDPPMGEFIRNLSFDVGLFPCLTSSQPFSCRFGFAEQELKYPLPPGHLPIDRLVTLHKSETTVEDLLHYFTTTHPNNGIVVSSGNADITVNFSKKLPNLVTLHALRCCPTIVAKCLPICNPGKFHFSVKILKIPKKMVATSTPYLSIGVVDRSFIAFSSRRVGVGSLESWGMDNLGRIGSNGVWTLPNQEVATSFFRKNSTILCFFQIFPNKETILEFFGSPSKEEEGKEEKVEQKGEEKGKESKLAAERIIVPEKFVKLGNFKLNFKFGIVPAISMEGETRVVIDWNSEGVSTHRDLSGWHHSMSVMNTINTGFNPCPPSE